MEVKRSKIIEVLRNCDYKVESVLRFVEETSEKSFTDQEFKDAERKIKSLKKAFNKKYRDPKINMSMKAFIAKYPEWLNSTEVLEISKTYKNKSDSLKHGRPALSFEESSQRSKRRKVADVLQKCENSTELLLQAAKRTAFQSGDQVKAKIIDKIIREQNSTEIMKKIETSMSTMSDTDALDFFVNANLTVSQYELTRSTVNAQGHKIFPIYKKVAAAKELCYPRGIQVTATCAFMPWNELVYHTVARIVESQREILEDRCSLMGTTINLDFIISVGMDGSSGQSHYNQKISENQFESSIFVNAMNPLRLTTSNGDIMWTNPAPHSTRFCRTQKIIFQKETESFVTKEYASMMKDLNELEIFSIPLNTGKKLTFLN